jgi:hypothetical protein
MLPDWTVGFRRNCTLLLNTAIGFSARISWIEFFDAISGLFSGPAFLVFLIVGFYGWIRGGKIITRK